MNVKPNLYYTKTHEWVEFSDNGAARIGITDHAQEAMGDIVYIDLPEIGDELAAGEDVCIMESVKAVADIYAPLGGEVTDINEAVLDEPGQINGAPYDSWLFEIQYSEKNNELMTGEEYMKFLEESEEK